MIGFSINERVRCASKKNVDRFRRLPVAVVSDVMHRMSAGGAALRPMHRAGMLAGPALTVRTRPGDNLMVHKALDMASAGDVLVVEAGGDLTNAIIGELMIAHAKKRGVAGIVIYGAIRDLGSISEDDFPVFAAGVTHRGPYKDGPGEVNADISISGMVIRPGDIVLGDLDGLIAVPYEHLDAVYDLAKAKHQAEIRQLEAIALDENDRAWVDRKLASSGCIYITPEQGLSD